MKIRNDYQSQLEPDQKDDIKKKIEDYNTQVEKSIASAYSLIAKYSAKEG
ncbi:MAG: hypothetical protein U5Q03_04165 [Bacteroidota bacterium]|nr:hypothetical protein [Bacteroidota bacterium]